MKKIYLLLFSVIFLLSSCSFLREDIYSEDNNKLANNTYEKIVYAIKAKDSTALIKLFSQSILSENPYMKENAEKLIEWIEGEVVSYSDASKNGVSADMESQDGAKRKVINYSCQLNTSTQTYYIAIEECTVDDFNANNVGILSLHIINTKDWFNDYVYRTSGVQGIKIDIPIE